MGVRGLCTLSYKKEASSALWFSFIWILILLYMIISGINDPKINIAVIIDQEKDDWFDINGKYMWNKKQIVLLKNLEIMKYNEKIL